MESRKHLQISVIAILIMSLVFGAASFEIAAAASSAPKLSVQSMSIKAGSTKELRVKNTSKKNQVVCIRQKNCRCKIYW